MAVLAVAAAWSAEAPGQPAGVAASAPLKAPAKAMLAAADGPAWSALTPAQQAALAPLRRDWPGIDAPRKQKWLDIAARFPSMPEAERERVQARMTEWARMSPAERGQVRLQFQEARQIPAQERQARWDAYLALPVEERAALARRSSSIPKVDDAKANRNALAVLPNQKVNVVNAPSKPAAPQVVGPTVVQAKPGASTTLISKTPTPPVHDAPGEPKISVPGEQVNRATLLPQAAPPRPAAPAPAPAVPAAAITAPVGVAPAAPSVAGPAPQAPSVGRPDEIPHNIPPEAGGR